MLARVGRLGLPLAGLSVVLFRVWGSAVTELSLSCVDAAVEVLTVLVLAVVGAVLDVDLGLGVALVWLAVAIVGSSVMSRVTLGGTRQGTPSGRRRVKVEMRGGGEALLLRTTH